MRIRIFTILPIAIIVGLFATAALAQENDTASQPFGLVIVMRWVHILSAIGMLGGALFIRVVLKSAIPTLPEEAREPFAVTVRARWKKLVMLYATLLIVSGFYNYLMVTRFDHPDTPLYHALFGIKFLMAMAVFALAMFLVGRTSLAQRIQSQDKLYLSLLAAMGIGVVLIAGYMKVL